MSGRLLGVRRKRAEVARRSRQELIEARLGRRDLAKMGLLTGAGLLVTTAGLSARADEGGGDQPTSPPTTPFVQPLPIANVAAPVPSLNPAPGSIPVPGEAPRAPHQYWQQYLPRKLYDFHVREAGHSFHPELPPSTVWGFNGVVPAPTIHARHNEPIVVRFHNDLPADHVGFGMPQISTHLHNGHTASESDGFPGDFYGSGLFKDNHYINECAGFSTVNSGDPREMLGTLWYHDHRVEFTAQNAYKGLAGFYLLFDEVDSGDETDPSPTALRLPSGEFDVPLVFADKLFDAEGQLFFDLFNLDGILGDKFTVNGAIQPFLQVARRKYRFRLLNTGPSRFYGFYLSNGQPFLQIANDGNLLPAPVTVQSVTLSVAERADVIVDFSNARIGDQIVLQNRLVQQNGRGPTGEISAPGDALLRFDVVRDARDDSRVPATLRALPPIDLSAVAQTRSFRFERGDGAWKINDQFFDIERVDATPRRGTAEIWVFQNHSGGWSHPIHVHLEELRILSRNGSPPGPTELGRKDVVRLGPNEEIRVLLHFRDFLGRYPLHCHNMVHEDHAMMLRWDCVP